MSDITSIYHYHLDGVQKHLGEDCRWCKNKQKMYLFNVMQSEIVYAKSLEEAYAILNHDVSEIKDRDVMLVEITLVRNG